VNKKENAPGIKSSTPVALAIALAASLTAGIGFVLAQDSGTSPADQSASTPAGGAGDTTSTGTSTTAPQTTEPLQGQVKMVELTLDDIRTLSLDVKHLTAASSHLHDEVTMQRISVEQEPEIIGMGTVIMIPVGYQKVGPILPANKKRVDLAMNEVRPIIQLFKEDLDEFMTGQKKLDLTDAVREDLKPYFDDWIGCVNDASAQLTKLEPLTQGPPYDQTTIASIAADINQDAQKMQNDLKKVYKIVRKEGKKMKRS